MKINNNNNIIVYLLILRLNIKNIIIKINYYKNIN